MADAAQTTAQATSPGPAAPGPAAHPFAGRASAWFAELRDRLCAAFEAIEDEGGDSGPHADLPPGRFERTAWRREGGGGGVMSVLRGGRVFEKAGVNIARIPPPDPGGGGGSTLPRRRGLARRPSAQPAGAGGAHEHPLHRHPPRLVRRWR